MIPTYEDTLQRYAPGLYERLSDRIRDYMSNIPHNQSHTKRLRTFAIYNVIVTDGCFYCAMSNKKCLVCPAYEHGMCGTIDALHGNRSDKIYQIAQAGIRYNRKRFEKLREEILEFIVEFTPEVTKQYIESKKDAMSDAEPDRA